MVNTNKLKAVIVERGTTQEQVAKAIGITPKAFYVKMKNGVFKTNEAQSMIELLNIENPVEIFFAK